MMTTPNLTTFSRLPMSFRVGLGGILAVGLAWGWFGANTPPPQGWVWVAFGIAFAIGSIRQAPPRIPAHFGLHSVATLVVGLALGPQLAATLVFSGLVLVAVVRRSRNRLPWHTLLDETLLVGGLAACALIALRVGATASLDPSASLVSAVQTLLIVLLAVMLAHLLGAAMTRVKAIPTPYVWNPHHRRTLWVEAILALQVVPLVIIAGDAPPLALTLIVLGGSLAAHSPNTAQPKPTVQPAPKEAIPVPAAQFTMHLEVGALLQEVERVLSEVTPASALFIALYDGDETRLMRYVLVSSGGRHRANVYHMLQAESIEKRLLTEGATLHIGGEALGEAAFTLNPLPIEAATAFLGLPLIKDGQPFGVLGLLDDQRDAFTPQEIQHITALAGPIGASLQNARLYTDRTRLVDNLSQINNTVQTLLFNLDGKKVIETICDTAMTVTQADRATIHLLDRDTGRMTLLHAAHMPNRYLHLDEIQNAAPHPMTPRVVHDVQLIDDAVLKRHSQIGGYRAFAETHLTSGTLTTGLLTVYHRQPYGYPSTELDLLKMLANQITVSLENTELLQALELYASEMAQLVHLSRNSLTSLQPEEVAANAIDMLREMFGVSSVIIATVDPVPEGNEVIKVLAQSPTNHKTPHRQSLNIYPELQALKDRNGPPRQLVHIDTPDISRGVRQLLMRNGEHTLAAVPMTAHNDIFGLMILGSQEWRYFNDREWQFVETATNLTAAQIQNAQVYNKTREALVRRLEQLAFIETLVQQVSASLDPAHIVESIFDATTRVTQADTVTLAQSGNGRYRLTHQQNAGDFVGRTTEVVTSVAGGIADVFESGEVVLSPAYGLPLDLRKTPLLGRYPSVLAVPLMQEREVIGVLAATSARRNAFTEEQALFLQNLAGHMVISLANARLMEERQGQVETLIKLRALSLAVAGVSDHREVARLVMEAAEDLLGWHSGGLYHYDDNAENEQLQALTVPWQEGHERMKTRLMNLPDLPTVREILAAGEARVLQEQTANGEGERIQVAVPLVRGDTVRDLMLLTLPENETPGSRELDMLGLLANQAAGHLETALLYQQIEASSNRMRAILESTHDGVILLDRSQRIMVYNATAEGMLGVSMEEHVGQPFSQLPLTYEETERAEVPREMMEGGNNHHASPHNSPLRRTELVLQHPAGEIRYLERTDLPVEDERNRVMGRLLLLRDLTEEKGMEKHRDEIIFMLVHDLRSPLGSVIAGLHFAQELLSDPNHLDYLPQVLQLAHSSSNRLLNLVNTLLDVERSQMTLMREVWHIESLLDSASGELIQIAKEVNIEVTRNLAPGLPLLNVDGEKLQRVLINLIDNALDYSKSSIHVRADLSDDGAWVLMRVSDDGPGIPPEKREEIFGKFSQAGGQEKRRTKHTGIGLTYCRRAVEAHGGHIWVAGDDDTYCDLPGACFVFSLPVQPIPELATTQEQTPL